MMGRRTERRFLRFRRKGDAAALAEVFDATAPEVLKVAMHFARDPAEAEDLVQRTFLTAIERAESFDARARLVPWLLGILANHAREAARRERRAVDPARLRSPGTEDPAARAADREQSGGAGRAIDALPDPYRSVLVLRFRHGMEPAEIANALGLPPATVRSHLHRGLERLRRALPVSLSAGAFADFPLVRGLASVRATVLARAEAVAPALAASAATAAVVAAGGLLVGKKALAAGAAAVLLLGGGSVAWWSSRPASRSEPATRSAAPTPEEHCPGLAAREAEAPGTAGSALAPGPVPPLPTGFGAILARVVSADGTPHAGVSLLAISGDASEPSPAPTAVTDADGRAWFVVTPGKRYVRAPAGPGVSVTVAAGETTEVTLTRKEGVRIEGEVVDAAGRPVAGAAVWASAGAAIWFAGVEATTDAAGRFVLPSVGVYAMLWARAPGHAPSGQRRVHGRAGTTERVRLHLGGAPAAIRGRVLDDLSKPVPGALVQVGYEFGGGVDLPDGTQGGRPAPCYLVTDAEGVFAADDLPEGASRVDVRAKGHAPRQIPIRLVSRAPTELVVRLGREGVIVGIARTADGRPAAGTWVSSRHPQEFLHRATAADAEGVFRLDGLPASGGPPDADGQAPRGDVSVSAVHDREGRADTSIAPDPGVDTRWDPVLRRGGTIAFRLVDETESPLAGVRVQAWVGGFLRFGGQATTDADGRGRIEAAERDTYELRAYEAEGPASQLPFGYAREIVPGGSEVLFRVRAEDRPSARVRGRVETPDGKIPVGTSVSVVSLLASMGPMVEVDAKTGSFEGGPFPPGSYALAVQGPGYGRVPLGQRTLAPGDALDLGTIALRRPGGVRVRVVRAQGTEGKGLNGHLDGGAGAVWIPWKDDVGLVPVLQPGRYLVVVTAWGVAAGLADVTVEEGKEAEVLVTLRRARSVPLLFTSEDGLPIEALQAQIRLEGREAAVQSLQFGASKEPPLESEITLPPGRYRVVASARGGRRADLEFEVREGEGRAERVTVRLGR